MKDSKQNNNETLESMAKLDDLVKKCKEYDDLIKTLIEKEKSFIIKFSSCEFEKYIICTDDDLIENLEEEVYKQYPLYKDINNTYLLANGEIIERNKKIKDYNIKQGSSIVITKNYIDK